MKWLFPIWKLQGDVSRPNYFSWVYDFIICITLWHLCHELKLLLHGLFNKLLGISLPFMNIPNQYKFYTDPLKVELPIVLELVLHVLEGKHPWIRRLVLPQPFYSRFIPVLLVWEFPKSPAHSNGRFGWVRSERWSWNNYFVWIILIDF